MTVLVVRKTDKTIHQVPVENKAALMSFSNRLPVEQRWTFEEMEDTEAKELPFIDKEYVTAADAVSKMKTLESEKDAKDSRIKELEALLAKNTANPPAASIIPLVPPAVNHANPDPAANNPAKTETALEVIDRINAATGPAHVTEILGADTRATVQAAAQKKIASFDIK